MLVSMNGKSNLSSAADITGPMSMPPTTLPSTIDPTVSPSIHALATTSLSGGSSSVRMPYLAGE